MTARPVIVNVKSRLLTDEENETVFHALGYKCRTLATTVAELYCNVEDKTKTWEKQDSGVVCFVKDFVKRSYFIRFYDRKDKTMMWEHDIRKFQGFEFTTSDGCIALIARDKKVIFLDKDEAEQFKREIQENLTKLKPRRVRRQGARNTTDAAPSGENAEDSKPTRKTSNKEKKKITKEDIANPAGFRHVNHVGWDPTSSNIDTKLDPQMRAVFEEIGISDQSQVDKETLDFIYDFIEKHGGAEGIIAEQKDVSKNSSRVRPPPPPLKGTTLTAPPPPPSNRQKALSPPPPPSSGNRPPPPPSGRNRSGLPPPPSRNQPPPPPPNRNQSVPPPPPPGRYQHPPPPPGRNRTGPPPPPSGRYQPPPPPPGRNQTVPPPPPSGRGNQHPPPPPDGRRQTSPSSTPPPSGGKQDEPSPHPQTAFQDASGGATGQDNPLKQQIMQLLLHNPTEITNFIYDIVNKRGGLDFIKDKFAGGQAQTDPSQNDDNESGTGSTDIQDPRSSSDDQVSGKTSNYDQIPGRSSNGDQVPGRSSTGDEVPGRRSDEKSLGATPQRFSDFELGSDVFDDDDGEWDDLNDQIDQY